MSSSLERRVFWDLLTGALEVCRECRGLRRIRLVDSERSLARLDVQLVLVGYRLFNINFYTFN